MKPICAFATFTLDLSIKSEMAMPRCRSWSPCPKNYTNNKFVHRKHVSHPFADAEISAKCTNASRHSDLSLSAGLKSAE